MSRLSEGLLTVKVEGRLPADHASEDSREWHAQNHPGVRAAEGESGETRALQWRGPEPPDTVARGVRHALQGDSQLLVQRDLWVCRKSSFKYVFLLRDTSFFYSKNLVLIFENTVGFLYISPIM